MKRPKEFMLSGTQIKALMFWANIGLGYALGGSYVNTANGTLDELWESFGFSWKERLEMGSLFQSPCGRGVKDDSIG